jgi:hypothetical protein
MHSRQAQRVAQQEQISVARAVLQSDRVYSQT